MNKNLPARTEVPVEFTWDLTTIYMTDAEWEAAFAALPAQLDALERYQGRLGESAATLLESFQLSDAVGQRLGRMAVYAFLRKDEDTTNATYQALADRAQQLLVRASAAESYVRPELLALPDGTLERFQAEEPGLRLYAHVFDDLLRGKPHVLSPAEETLLAEAGELAAAPGTIYEMLSDADMKFGTVTDEEGTEVELTEGRYTRFVRSQHRPLRAEAFTKLLGAYQAHRNTCAASFSSNVKSDLFYARARKYPSALEAALHPDNIPVSVYTNLISAVHDKLPLLHRYLRLRKQVLGLDELHMYDIHVPLVMDTADTVPYTEAQERVLGAFAPLGEEYVAAARTGLGSRWVDVYETPNKRSGAYSWGAFDTNPFILLNYQETLRDVYTLAHEMGHTMHSYFTRRTQPYVYGNYTLFVAEVASTLNEALLTHYLLQHTTDPAVRLAIVNNNLDNLRGTLYRQTMFAEFEKITHEAAEAGEALTADRLSEMFYDLNKQYHGPDTVSDDLIAVEWARIPHFYRSFYVYKYATGISAAQALAQQIITEGAPAVERYLRFLSRGSSAYSIDLLRDAGVDMTSPQPVAQALDVFGDLLDEMEQLLTQTGKLQPAPAGSGQ
jgi:oligoendopeptidase F